MSGERHGMGRIAGLCVALACALLLLLAREAEAGKYSVAQCGWHLGADATWADTTGGAKFRPDAWCATPPGSDPFDGAHMKSFTKAGSTVSGTRFARWRWEAPAGTNITRVAGTWWQALHDGMEQRIGAVSTTGGFVPFAIAASTNVTPRNFVAGFGPGVHAIEDRLLCARAEHKHCSLSPGSWSSVRALTLTLEDNSPPAAGIGGELFHGGWRRGVQGYGFWGGELGAGIHYGETTVDGARVNLTHYPCALALVGSEWRATTMRPCPLGPSGGASLATTSFSDGVHSVRHCVVDFAGNPGCTATHAVAIDNNPPAHPRSPAVAGGDGWHRVNDFDLTWSNPDQGPASPVGAALWRISGSAGHDTGVRLAAGRNITSIANRTVPAPGTYEIQLWLRDEAGNDSPATAVTLKLRFDNVAPEVAFTPTPEPQTAAELPHTVSADVSDEHAGAAGGEVLMRRIGTDRWVELATKFSRGTADGTGRLTARVPDGLPPGTYAFRADALDAAGNPASSTRRADGSQMAIRKTAPAAGAHQRREGGRAAAAPAGAKTRIFARLRWRRRSGTRITVPFGAPARLNGRLLNADGIGLGGRRLRVVSRPSRGAVSRKRVDVVRTGPHGGFRLGLSRGPSRRVTVSFLGEHGLGPARRPGLALRVRGGVLMRLAPRSVRTGEVVHFRGRVRTRGAALPRRGKLVAIQYFEHAARRWRPVQFARADHTGRFRSRYRFRYINGTARIRLRAVVVAEERWPYVPGASRPLTVRVSG